MGGGGSVCIMCVCACVCACVCVCARACMCVRVRERERERETKREFCPLSGFRYTGTLRPVPVYRTEATRIGALGIAAAYRQPYYCTQGKLLNKLTCDSVGVLRSDAILLSLTCRASSFCPNDVTIVSCLSGICSDV